MCLVMILLTIIIIVSSFLRMNLYERAYGYTVLRLLVYVTLITETILMIPTIIYIFNSKFKIIKYYIIIITSVYTLINFANIDKVAEEAGKFDFVLADLGVSSMQIDNPERGFSYKIDGPLDLRLDPNHGDSAAERLHNITEEEFVGMMIENSDEPYAEEIAHKVFTLMSKGNPMDTTTALREANFLCVQRTPDNTYMGVHNANERQIHLLAAAKLLQSDLDYFALEESRKVNNEPYDQVHKAPIHEASEGTPEKRKPGRPKGTTKKATGNEPKRRPGRPKGAKNKPKQESVKTDKQTAEIPCRGPGRPKGSKNKKPAIRAKEKRTNQKK